MKTPYQAWIEAKRPIFSRLPGVRGAYSKNLVADYLTSYWDKFLMFQKLQVDNLISKNLDPDICDREYLDYLGFLHFFTEEFWDKNWSDSAKRNLIKNAFPIIWQYFGTALSLSTVINCFGIDNEVVTVNDFRIGISEIGDRIGDLAWIYEIRISEEYRNTDIPALVYKLDQLFGSHYCEKSIVFVPKPETILSVLANNYQSRLIAASVVPDIEKIRLIDQYFLRPINNSTLKNKIKLANIFTGNQLNEHKVPVIGTNNLTLTHTQDQATVQGLHGGNDAYINFNETPVSLDLSNEDVHISVYGSNLANDGVETLVSSHNGSNWIVLYAESSTLSVFSSQLSPAYAVRGNNDQLTPFIIGQNKGRSNTVLFGNGERVAYFPNANVGSKMTPGSAVSTAYLLGQTFDSNGFGSTVNYSSATFQTVTIGDALDKIEAKLLWEITDATNQKLNRSSTPREVKKFVVLSPESYQGIQRDVFKNTADIEIQVLYREYKVTKLIAQYGTNAPQTIALLTTPGSYQGILKRQPTGQETLKIWLENDLDNVQVINKVTIGDGFVVGGQSNGEGVFFEPYVPSGLMYELCLHNHVGGWQAYTDPSSATTGAGSVWGKVGELLVNRYKVPVFFVCTALGGTGLVYGHWDREVGFCYEQSIYTAKQTQLKNIRAVLFPQGENDAYYGATIADYRNSALLLPDWFDTDLGYKDPIIVIMPQIGLFNAATEANVNAIREAQKQAWNVGGNLKAGFPTFFRNLAANDGAHWQTNDDRIVLAKLWERAIAHWCYGSLEGRAPRFESANTVGSTVTIYFQDGYGDLTPGSNPEIGWLGADGTGLMIPDSVQVIENRVILTFPRNVGSPGYVSFATGFFGTNNTIRDSGTITQYPLEPFQEQVN